MADYNYTISTDFPNQAVAPDKLTNEINDSSISSAQLDWIELKEENDECKCKFSGSLSGADETTLDGIVAAHDGVPYADVAGGAWVFSGAQSTTTSDLWQEKCSLDLGSIQAGDYKIELTFEWDVTDTDNDPAGNFRLQINDTTTIWSLTTFPLKRNRIWTDAVNLFYTIDTAGSYYIDFDYHSDSGSELRVRNVSIDVVEVL